MTGEAAEEVDLLSNVKGRLPYAAALLITPMLGLLTTLTGAPVVVIKADMYPVLCALFIGG